jgi:hypothetical protein
VIESPTEDNHALKKTSRCDKRTMASKQAKDLCDRISTFSKRQEGYDCTDLIRRKKIIEDDFLLDSSKSVSTMRYRIVENVIE